MNYFLLITTVVVLASSALAYPGLDTPGTDQYWGPAGHHHSGSKDVTAQLTDKQLIDKISGLMTQASISDVIKFLQAANTPECLSVMTQSKQIDPTIVAYLLKLCRGSPDEISRGRALLKNYADVIQSLSGRQLTTLRQLYGTCWINLKIDVTTTAGPTSTTTIGGSTTTMGPGGSTTTMGPGGSTTTMGPGGSTTTMGPGGSTTTMGPGGSTTTMGPGGSTTTMGPGGSTTTMGPGGSTTTMGPGGSTTTMGPGGSTTTMGPGGSTTTMGPGGSTTTMGPGGSTTTMGPGGSTTTMGPGGSTTTMGPGGSTTTRGPGLSTTTTTTSSPPVAPVKIIQSGSEFQKPASDKVDYDGQRALMH